MQCLLSVHYFKVLYCQLFYVVTDFFFNHEEDVFKILH